MLNFKDCKIDQNHSGSGNNIKKYNMSLNCGRWWDSFFSWQGLIGTLATIGFGILSYYGMCEQFGWNFFGILQVCK